ncbi:hypothetical protein L484_021369 [Morus notabilis]|uniref:Uncharacterized protein n=1 Tax=Morus notabilis TaxID=981085 RepID=W9S6G9_9ROSA|nr:hypothetical protein L484_021369 [Morus notabilis]
MPPNDASSTPMTMLASSDMPPPHRHNLRRCHPFLLVRSLMQSKLSMPRSSLSSAAQTGSPSDRHLPPPPRADRPLNHNRNRSYHKRI